MKRRYHLSTSDMRGYIVIGLTILAIVALAHMDKKIFNSTEQLRTLSTEEMEELSQFSQQIKLDSIRQQKLLNEKYKRHRPLTPFKFDPNTADSVTLVQIGLKSWQISNLLKYRKKGGRWKTPDDFARLYGMSKEEFSQLRPYIHIKQSSEQKKAMFLRQQRDSIRKSYPQKFEPGTVLQLNEADTTALKRIPGIGSYYASKICRYRERLGGFVDVRQLKEIEGLPKDIEKWFTISPKTEIRKTKINKTDFKGLIRHPYLNYEQVKAICNYIRKYGKIKSFEDLSNSEHFNETDRKRLEPYISFE